MQKYIYHVLHLILNGFEFNFFLSSVFFNPVLYQHLHNLVKKLIILKILPLAFLCFISFDYNFDWNQNFDSLHNLFHFVKKLFCVCRVDQTKNRAPHAFLSAN